MHAVYECVILLCLLVVAMSDCVDHSTSMQLAEASLCFSVIGIFCTIIILIVIFICYSPMPPETVIITD